MKEQTAMKTELVIYILTSVKVFFRKFHTPYCLWGLLYKREESEAELGKSGSHLAMFPHPFKTIANMEATGNSPNATTKAIFIRLVDKAHLGYERLSSQ